MPVEMEQKQIEEEQIVYEQSIVIETMLFVGQLVSQQPPKYNVLNELYEELVQHSAPTFMRKFGNQAEWSLVGLLVHIPEVHSMTIFTEHLRKIQPSILLFELWNEMIELDIIERALTNPETVNQLIAHEEVAMDEASLHYIMKNAHQFQLNIVQLLNDIAQHPAFLACINENHTLYEAAIANVHALQLKPLQRAQYVMGKTFRRVHPYKIYYFIPTIMVERFRLRIFDERLCFIIYAVASPMIDRQQQIAQMAKELKLIADPTRLQILHAISSQKQYGARLAEYLSLTTATVSHHLEVLKKANLIIEEKIGTIKYYRTNKEKVDELLNELKQLTTQV